MSRTPPRRPGGWFSSRPVGAKIGAAVGLWPSSCSPPTPWRCSASPALRDHQETIYPENLLPLNALPRCSARTRPTASGRSSTPSRTPSVAPSCDADGGEDRRPAGRAWRDYEPFIVDQEAMDTFAATRSEFLELVESQLLPAADRGTRGVRRRSVGQLQPLLQIIADEIEAEGVAQSSQAPSAASRGRAGRVRSHLLLVTALPPSPSPRADRADRPPDHPDRRLGAALRRGHGRRRPDRPDRLSSQDELGRMAAALDAAQESLRDVHGRRWSRRRTRWRRRRRSCRRRRRRSRRRRRRPARSPAWCPARRRRSRRNVQTVAAGCRADGCVDPGDRAERRRGRGSPAGRSPRRRRRRRRWPSWASPRPRSATWSR